MVRCGPETVTGFPREKLALIQVLNMPNAVNIEISGFGNAL